MFNAIRMNVFMLSVSILNPTMKNIFMLSVNMLYSIAVNVVMLDVAMLSVVRLSQCADCHNVMLASIC